MVWLWIHSMRRLSIQSWRLLCYKKFTQQLRGLLVLKLLLQLLYTCNLIFKSLLKQNFYTFPEVVAFLKEVSQTEKSSGKIEETKVQTNLNASISQSFISGDKSVEDLNFFLFPKYLGTIIHAYFPVFFYPLYKLRKNKDIYKVRLYS